MAGSSGFATICTSAEADEDAIYAVNRDGVRLKIVEYEFPTVILANSSSRNVKYHWRHHKACYLISDDRDHAQPEHGEARFLEIGKIVSGDKPDRYLFKNMTIEKAEKDVWRRGSNFIKDPKASPVFVKCTKYLAPKAEALVGYRRDAKTGLLDLAAVDIDCVFLFDQILTPEILSLPVKLRVPKMRAIMREFAAKINMQDPDIVPKVPVVKSTTDTALEWSPAANSDLETVVNKCRMMFEVWKSNKADSTPLQGALKLIEQKLASEHQGPDNHMLEKFVEDGSEFSLEDMTKFQQEMKALYQKSHPIDPSFAQALHTAIHTQHLADAIPKRDVIWFLELAHVCNENALVGGASSEDHARAEAIAPFAAKLAAKSSEVASWSFPRPKEYDSDTTRAFIQHIYAALVGISARMESAALELEEQFGGVRTGSWSALSKKIGEAIDRKTVQEGISEGMAITAELMKAAYAPGAGDVHDLLQIVKMMMKN